MTKQITKQTERRDALQKKFWPDEPVLQTPKKGWFPASRTLPLLLTLLASKKVSGTLDPSRVYLELLARHIDGGIVEITNEADCAFASGYTGSRAVRTWQERMKLLERIGLIKTRSTGTQLYKYALLLDIDSVIEKLNKANKVSAHWQDAYFARKLETGEISNPRPKEKSKS